ncbi:MAG: hypothetical protein AB8G05_26485 [Oligoflexales bacterium]
MLKIVSTPLDLQSFGFSFAVDRQGLVPKSYPMTIGKGGSYGFIRYASQ